MQGALVRQARIPLDVRVAHNTVCNNPGTDILAEGGFTGNILFPVPNAGTGNMLTGEIFQNTATTVTVDGWDAGEYGHGDAAQQRSVPIERFSIERVLSWERGRPARLPSQTASLWRRGKRLYAKALDTLEVISIVGQHG